MVLKSNHCCQKTGQWKTWCGNRTVTRKSSISELYSTLCSGAWHFWNLDKYHCFIVIVLHISIWEGGLELCLGGANPTKGPPWWWLVYAAKLRACFLMQLTRKSTKVMQYVKLAREDMWNFLFTSMTGTKVIQRIQVSNLLWGKICAGTILLSSKHNWLK